MIAYLKGKIIKKNINSVIINVNGVGYLVYTPLSTLTQINTNEEVELYITAIIKENVFELYGFLTEKEQKIFDRLMKVPKIGPRMACMILSGMEPDKIVEAIKKRDIKLLSSIPKIGKKTAERICVDLRDKFDFIHTEAETKFTKKDELISALINLGFKKQEIENIVENIFKKYSSKNLEELLKLTLNEIYK